jgi:hypothetical protein
MRKLGRSRTSTRLAHAHAIAQTDPSNDERAYITTEDLTFASRRPRHTRHLTAPQHIFIDALTQPADITGEGWGRASGNR